MADSDNITRNDDPSVESMEILESKKAPLEERQLSVDGESESIDEDENDGDNEESEDEENQLLIHNDYDALTQPYMPRRCRRSSLDTLLPDTVTRLETPEGNKVYLVGTAHFSLESQEDVARTIQATQPDVVVVELCKGRVNILRLDEATIIEEAKNMNLEKIRTTIKQNGFVHGIMYLFLLSMSAHITKQLGMAPGGEFRRAFSEARKVPGCLVHLGDRPIQVTLHRALAELSWWQKVCLAWCLVTSKDPISKEEVERCKNRDLLEEMLAEMTGKFPAFSQVFVRERDIYLTHSLQLAASSLPCHHSDDGNVPSVVVGVVGIGHVPGIIQLWGNISEEDIPELLRIPETSVSSRIIKYTIKTSVWSLIAWGCYKLLVRPPVINLLSKIISTRTPK